MNYSYEWCVHTACQQVVKSMWGFFGWCLFFPFDFLNLNFWIAWFKSWSNRWAPFRHVKQMMTSDRDCRRGGWDCSVLGLLHHFRVRFSLTFCVKLPCMLMNKSKQSLCKLSGKSWLPLCFFHKSYVIGLNLYLTFSWKRHTVRSHLRRRMVFSQCLLALSSIYPKYISPGKRRR